MPKKVTTKIFIEAARLMHGDQYDYSKVDYKRAQESVCIICPKHGEFQQVPNHHLKGSGCPRCSYRARLTTDDFITRAKEIHGEIFDYQYVNYKNAHTPVRLVCRKHGPFTVKAGSHLRGTGCPVCAQKSRTAWSESDLDIYSWRLKIKALDHIRKIFQMLGISTKREFQLGEDVFDLWIPELRLVISYDDERRYGLIPQSDSKIKKMNQKDLAALKNLKSAGYRIARIPYWLSLRQIGQEIYNIITERPTYPEVPDLKQKNYQPNTIDGNST